MSSTREIEHESLDHSYKADPASAADEARLDSPQKNFRRQVFGRIARQPRVYGFGSKVQMHLSMCVGNAFRKERAPRRELIVHAMTFV